MRYDLNKHQRRSMRLTGYDYTAPGAYFVTMCAYGGECLFGEVVDGAMRLGDYGRVAATMWQRVQRHFPHVELDEWVVMPNHMHGIIVILESAGASGRGEAFPDWPLKKGGLTSDVSTLISERYYGECLAPTPGHARPVLVLTTRRHSLLIGYTV